MKLFVKCVLNSRKSRLGNNANTQNIGSANTTTPKSVPFNEKKNSLTIHFVNEGKPSLHYRFLSFDIRMVWWYYVQSTWLRTIVSSPSMEIDHRWNPKQQTWYDNGTTNVYRCDASKLEPQSNIYESNIQSLRHLTASEARLMAYQSREIFPSQADTECSSCILWPIKQSLSLWTLLPQILKHTALYMLFWYGSVGWTRCNTFAVTLSLTNTHYWRLLFVYVCGGKRGEWSFSIKFLCFFFKPKLSSPGLMPHKLGS